MKKILVFAALVAMVAGCKKEEATTAEQFYYSGKTSYEFDGTAGSVSFKIQANCSWNISADEWISVSPASFTPSSTDRVITEVAVNVPALSGVSGRSGKMVITYGKAKEQKEIVVNQSAIKSCTVDRITDDIIFSTGCAGTTTSVQQGFDFSADYGTVYFSQVTSNHRNTLSWRPRVQITTETTVAPNKMILYYFSHGNNIRYEKGSDGADYLWIGNYGTVDPDNSYTYTAPQILSRIKLVAGTKFKNTQATDNYYFGVRNIHVSFDVDNDLIAVYSGYVVRIYRLSDVLNTPVTNVTLKESITYGGLNAPDAEYTGCPVVSAHDCSGMTPLHTFTYNYTAAGRGWQTFCIKDGRVYFFLFDKKYKTTTMAYQSTIDIFDYNGKLLREKILQPFADNLTDLAKYGFTDEATKYMENEGILIRDGAMYLLYTAKGSVGVRRPVIFRFAIPES